MMLRRRGVCVAASVFVLVVIAGCGGEGATRFSGDGKVGPGGGGSLDVAIPGAPGIPDPLHEFDGSSALVARQIYEPLVAHVPAPYGRHGSARGLALGWRHSGDFRVWRFRLRDGVEFQDGTPVDGSAIVANAARWRADPAGRALVPGLLAADAPSPATVRFILGRQARKLPEELSNRRLGLISPPALKAAGGGVLPLAAKAGTGPFEQTAEDPGVLVRYPGWWGSGEGLGPALDEIRFRSIASMAGREALLADGEVRLATGVSAAAADRLRQNPLLAAFDGPEPGGSVAIQRSVRGIDSTMPVPFSSVWLTVLGGAAG